MPTSFWVTCPSLVAAISRVESTGGVREARDAVGESVIEEIHSAHCFRYGTRVAGVRDAARGSVKCLHAFTALHIAGALPNPIAEWTLGRLGNPTRNATAAPRKSRMTSCYTRDRTPGAWRNRQTHRT